MDVTPIPDALRSTRAPYGSVGEGRRLRGRIDLAVTPYMGRVGGARSALRSARPLPGTVGAAQRPTPRPYRVEEASRTSLAGLAGSKGEARGVTLSQRPTPNAQRPRGNPPTPTPTEIFQRLPKKKSPRKREEGGGREREGERRGREERKRGGRGRKGGSSGGAEWPCRC